MQTQKYRLHVYETYNDSGQNVHFQYLPYNGRHHSLVWEKEANDLDETKEQELIFVQNKFNVSFHRFPNVTMFMNSRTEMCDYNESLHMGLTIGVPNGT